MKDIVYLDRDGCIMAFDPVKVDRETPWQCSISYGAVYLDGHFLGRIREPEPWTPPWERTGPNRKARRNR